MEPHLLTRVLTVIVGANNFSQPARGNGYTRLAVPKNHLPGIMDVLGHRPTDEATLINGVLVWDIGQDYLFSSENDNHLVALLARIKEAEKRLDEPVGHSAEAVRQKLQTQAKLAPGTFACRRDPAGHFTVLIHASLVRSDEGWKPADVIRDDRSGIVIFSSRSPESLAAAVITAVNGNVSE